MQHFSEQCGVALHGSFVILIRLLHQILCTTGKHCIMPNISADVLISTIQILMHGRPRSVLRRNADPTQRDLGLVFQPALACLMAGQPVSRSESAAGTCKAQTRLTAGDTLVKPSITLRGFILLVPRVHSRLSPPVGPPLRLSLLSNGSIRGLDSIRPLPLPLCHRRGRS